MTESAMLTEAEEKLGDYLSHRSGGFFTQLIGAMMVADGENRSKLACAYPELMAAVYKYQNVPGYADRFDVHR